MSDKPPVESDEGIHVEHVVPNTRTDQYKKKQKVQPRRGKGFFNHLRNTSVVVLLGVFYLFPWINWGGRQAVLWDLPNRKFYIFDLVIWPQDFIYLTALLIIAALALFFFTTVAGRLWCGYACPQTVWARALLWIEELVEGDRNKRIKLDKAPWNGEKITKKGTKYLLWAVFALWTGFTFVGYFSPIRDLVERAIPFNWGVAETFWIFFYALMTWLLGAVMREQVCVYMCPYARFQSVMYDPNTLLIAYDEQRGEPRGKVRRKAKLDAPEGEPKGDCVDCSVCVQVCPMGIDIRDGLQYQCTGCALCIDACDEIMEKVNKPKKLIRYTTENALKGEGVHILRPRVWVYSALILAMLGGVAYGLLTRSAVELDVIRDRNALFRDAGDGRIENLFRLRIMNKDDIAHAFAVELRGLSGAELVMDDPIPSVAPGSVHDHIVRVQLDPAALRGKRSTEFEILLRAEDGSGVATSEDTRYLGPTEY